MLLVIVGEGHRNEDEKRYDGEDPHAQYRQRQQGDVELLVQVDADILAEAVGLFAGLTDSLQLIVGSYHRHSRCQQRHDNHQGNNAEQQNGKGVIIIVDFVFHGRRVEDHFHLDGAQRTEFHQVGNACHAQVVKAEPLHQRDQHRLDQLTVADVAKPPDEEGQFGEDVTVNQRMAEFLQEVGFFAVCTQRRFKSHFCHRAHSFQSNIFSHESRHCHR